MTLKELAALLKVTQAQVKEWSGGAIDAKVKGADTLSAEQVEAVFAGKAEAEKPTPTPPASKRTKTKRKKPAAKPRPKAAEAEVEDPPPFEAPSDAKPDYWREKLK